jgi:hypothetical protein
VEALGGPQDAEFLALAHAVAIDQGRVAARLGLAGEQLGEGGILVAAKDGLDVDVLRQQVGIGHLVADEGLRPGEGHFLALQFLEAGDRRIGRHGDLPLQGRRPPAAEDLPAQLVALRAEQVVAEDELHFLGQHVAVVSAEVRPILSSSLTPLLSLT